MEDTIVMVDGKPDIAKLIKLIKLVINAGNTDSDPEEATHIAEAVRIVENHFMPDLIRLDIKVPGMDAHEMCKRVMIDSSLSEDTTVLVGDVEANGLVRK